ncbi:homolog of Uncharacterized protein MAL7P1.13, P.falciparum [Babesia bigemina]|uniref:Homolog of Uncharacterized protein MAL7P1.13, P.falciparum n=1 Tax=Babesia bigemina TaxID=5866 RepID=A0A061D9Q1_BABBI|nr:homolog of Uncharacterized protein MAL7P1.13, P.falciparum [Babesia bigemina]CDR97416.1 homolog of Uncharacterized protein MAL7P1.13, P.falciparum [Babesia bigemina]|eukprot:XP_012769602.1 homolog of Uncharacterized protein MAL7P1.13, P.falciparum [Babesia bigemina]
MVLSDELRELGSGALDSDNWKPLYASWSTRTTEHRNSSASSGSASLSSSHSLKSGLSLDKLREEAAGYLSQIKLGMDSREFLTEPHQETTTATKLHAPKPSDKYDRVKKLEDSLCGLQSNVESKRSNILEEIYQKINNLEAKIAESEAQERRACSEVTKKIDAIQRSITTAKTKHEAETKEAVVKMEAVYQRFTEALRAEKEQWKQAEKDAVNDINSHIKRIRDDLDEMKKSKTHVASYLRQYIDNELPQLKMRVASAGDDIAAMEKTIAASTHDDLLTLASFIKQETMQLNEMKRNTMLEVNKHSELLKAQLVKEREERIQMQQRMVSLMEETLKRLGTPL